MASMNFEYKPVLPVEDNDCRCCCYPASQVLASAKKPPESESDLEPTKVRYQAGVLVGNWFNRRAEYVPPPNDWRSVYDTFYTCKVNENLHKERKAQQENKERVERGIGAEFLIEHYGADFHKNFTTTNDLFYRVLPSGRCGPQKRKYSSRKDTWLPQVDLTKNFGNLTELGLKEAIDCEIINAAKPMPRISIHASDFKKPILTEDELVERHPMPRGKMNEPYLCHLDIDPDLPFRPHFVRTSA